MTKLTPLQVKVIVDNKDIIKKFKEAHRATEDFSDALQTLLGDIKIGIRIVHVKEKKWWQIWK